MVDAKVLIGVPTDEYARRSDFYDYFNLLEKENCLVLFVHERSPAKARNILIEQAMSFDCTHVLFIDDDMAFKADSLKKLLSHNKDIVSGLYFSRAFPHQPMVFDIADEESGACLHMYMEDDTPALVPIVAAGFGFLLCKTDVFRRMDKPWVRLGELDPQEWCDDIGFFRRARAAGIESYCDTTVRVGHIGTMIIWPNKMDDKWYSGYDTTGIGISDGNERLMVNTPQIPVQEQKRVEV